jgi:hypothetical protein
MQSLPQKQSGLLLEMDDEPLLPPKLMMKVPLKLPLLQMTWESVMNNFAALDIYLEPFLEVRWKTLTLDQGVYILVQVCTVDFFVLQFYFIL